MSPILPLRRRRFETDRQGRNCIIDVSIEQTFDTLMYPPDGIKSVYKILRETSRESGDYEIIYLIDNHEPHGYHSHPKLPENHNIRTIIHVSTWKEAWDIFDKKRKEILNEA